MTDVNGIIECVLMTNRWCLIKQGVETVAVRSDLELPLAKNHTEELQLKKAVVSCESKDKHAKIERVEVITVHTRGTQKKERTEELSCACQNMLTSDRIASTESISKVQELHVEDKVNRCRSSSIDCSDEETSFVKL
jgi:hypothetical protein